MFWYIVICTLMMYPFSLICVGTYSKKNTDRIALFAACVILCFFMAMRAETVGVDTKFYSFSFSQFSEIPWNRLFSAQIYATESGDWFFDFEPGYRIYNKLLAYISNSGQMITICNSVVIITLLYQFIKKESPNYMLSIWLYITLGVFQTEMNVTRNAIAILIAYNAFDCIRKKELIKYIVWCYIASTFHSAALIFIPLYWIVNYWNFTMNKCFSIVLGSILFGILCPYITPFLFSILPANISKYLISENENLQSIMVGMLHICIFVIVYSSIAKEERRRVIDFYRIGMIMIMLNICCFGLNLGLKHAARLAGLFGPYLIVFVPQLIAKIESRNKKSFVTILVVALTGMVYLVRLFINNIGGTMPYHFFWT